MKSYDEAKIKKRLRVATLAGAGVLMLSLTAGGAWAQTIPGTLNGNATYTDDASVGNVTAARTTGGTSAASPSFTVNFDGATTAINGNLTIGNIVQNWDNGGGMLGDSGTVYGNVTLNFSATQSTITGSVADTSASNSASFLNVTGGTLTIEGNVASTGSNLNVSVASGTTLMIDGNLGDKAVMSTITGGTLGVGGNIAAGNSFTINGGTLQVGSGTTGMGRITVSSAGGAATITSYNTGGDLTFSNASRPNMTIGSNAFTIQSNNGNVTFSDYAFGASGTGFSITGGGALTVQATGAGKNLNFNEGVNLDTTASNNAVTLSSAGGNVNIASGKAFTYTGGTGALNVNANQNVAFGGATTITQNNGGATTITATNGTLTQTGAFDYTGTTGALNMSAKGDVAFNSTTDITQTGAGATSITSTNGSITHTGAYTRTGVNGNLTETAATDLTFGAGATISFSGTGTTNLTAGNGGVSGSFTATGPFAYTSTDATTNSTIGNLNIRALDNVLFGSTSSITQKGDDATSITASTGFINHTGNFTYNGVDGNLTEMAHGDLTFGGDATITFTGSGSTALTSATGNIEVAGDFTYTGAGGNLNITAQTPGKTITFEQNTDITMTGNATTTITAADGDIVFGTNASDHFNYIGQNGNLVINAGPSGNIIYNANTVIDFTGGTGHVFEIVNTGNVIKNGTYTLLGGTGDIFMHAEKVAPNSGNVRQSDFQFTAGGGSVFISADVNINMNYGAGAADLKFDFSPVTAGGLGMVAGGDIQLNTNFIYTGGTGTGMGQVPNPSAPPPTQDNLHGEPVPGYGLYIATQNTEATPSKITFSQNAVMTMNNQKGLIRSPYLHNVGATTFDTYTGAGANTHLKVGTDFWTVQDDLTVNGSLFEISRLTPDPALAHDMPELYLLGSNTAASTANEQITVTYMNDGGIPIFNYIEADNSTSSFTTSAAGSANLNSNLRTELLRIMNYTAFNGDAAANLSGHVELVTSEALNGGVARIASTIGTAGMYAAVGYLGQETYYTVWGSPGDLGVMSIGDSFKMSGGFLSYRSVDSKIIFNNSYALGAGGYTLASRPLTTNSYIDWQQADFYGWMNLNDARTVMAAAMTPEVYTFPTQELLTAPLQMGYQNREWLAVDNTGIAVGSAEYVTLEDIPGFNPIKAYNPFPDSPFYNLVLGYLNDTKTSWGLVDFSRKMDTETVPANLANQAPNKYLSTMANVIEGADEFDIMDNPTMSATGVDFNTIENILYLSPTRKAYNRSLAAISAGGNLDAVRMVDPRAMKNIFDRLSHREASACYGVKERSDLNGLWVKANYRNLAMDSNLKKGYGGFDINSYGVTVGYDRTLVDNLLLGLYVSYNDINLDGLQRELDADDIQLGLYGKLALPAQFSVSAGFAYGWQNYDLTRKVSVGRDFLHNASLRYNENLKADFDGTSMLFALELAKTVCLSDNFYLRPTVGYTYNRVELDSYTEKSKTKPGAVDSVAQKVGGTTYNEHLLSAGASLGFENENLSAELGVAYVYNAGDDQATARANFANATSAAGSQQFKVSGAKYDTDYVNVSANLSYTPPAADNVTFSVGYSGQFSSKENVHAATASVTFTF